MIWKDSLQVLQRDSTTDTVREFWLRGVLCTEAAALCRDGGGRRADGSLVVRIPRGEGAALACGDRVRRPDSALWYTVAELYDSRSRSGGIGHRKLICKA